MIFPFTRQTTVTFGLELLGLALVLLALAFWARRGGRAGGQRLFISAGVLAGLGMLALVLAFTVAKSLPSPVVPFGAQFVTNPVPAGDEAIATGRTVFQKSCVICHGPRGLGDGAAALTLNPRPVNLRLHVPQHPDGDVYYWITEGIAGTAMAPWKEIIPERERWALVHYLRALARGEQ